MNSPAAVPVANATAHALNDLCYVCVVSEHLPPNYEACLAHRPRQVALIVSDSPKFGEAAKRLREMLEQALPGVRIDLLTGQPGSYPLQGDNVMENQRWARHVLLPWLLGDDRPHRRALNFTGGTKAMAAVLLFIYPWESLDYTGYGNPQVQRTRLTRDGEHILFEEIECRTVFSAPPGEVARLYAEGTNAMPLNRIIQNQPEATLKLARRIEEAQRQQDTALAELFTALDNIWGNQDKTYRRKHVHLTWPEFLGTPAPSAEQQEWLQAFAALAPDEFTLDENGLRLPGNKPTDTGKDLNHWISGIWLEQVAYEWLLEVGLRNTSIERNLISTRNKSDSNGAREADLIVREKNRVWVIEIKAGLPAHKTLSDTMQQLQSLGNNRFGICDKALLFGPALYRQQRASPQRWNSFIQNCAANDITLITSRDELARFISPSGHAPTQGIRT